MSRKRPAPGSAPIGYPPTTQQMQNSYQNGTQNGTQNLTDDQFFNWGANGQSPSTYPNQPTYNMSAPAFPPQPIPQASNQVARRPMNQVAPRPQQQNNQWPVEQAVTPVQQQQEPATTWTDDIDELVAKAQIAKRESQSKRKQIPPFVMKLHRLVSAPHWCATKAMADKQQLSRKPQKHRPDSMGRRWQILRCPQRRRVRQQADSRAVQAQQLCFLCAPTQHVRFS